MGRTTWIVHFLVVWGALLGILGASAGAEGPEARGKSPPVDISGEATWIATYAWGDPEGLEDTQDYALDRVILKQLLRLRVSGQISPGLRLSADLDNYRTGDMQLAQVDFEGKGVTGRFGNLRLGSENPYLLYNTALRGLQVKYGHGAFTATGVFGRAEGIAATRTFRGGVGSDAVVFLEDGAYSPARVNARLEASWDGLEHYQTSGRFIEGFMNARIRYEDDVTGGRTLRDTLTTYDLGYLYGSAPGEDGVISAGDALVLPSGSFAALSASGGDFLILLRESLDLVRAQVQKLVDDYNKKHGLTGDKARRYPFVAGSDTERAFLQDLAGRHAWIEAGPNEPGAAPILSTRLPAFARGRFYYLGHDEVRLGSVKVEVTKGGATYPAESVVGLGYSIFYDRGIVDFAFPPGFFNEYEGIRVSYEYSISGNVYPLGISVAAGSERVYLNGRLLRRDVDYTIDYPTGVLILLVGVGPDDELKVDYEYFRGGLGVRSEYSTNIMGGSLALQPREDLSLLFEAYHSGDVADSSIPAERRRTMPNAHTVVGASLRYSPGAFAVQADLAYSHDRFPLDDNRRANQGNGINAIMAGEEVPGDYVFFGHQGGLTVASPDGTGWREFTPASGLAGYTVLDIASSDDAWYFATEGGLTRVTRSGDVPFDRVDNWKRIRREDGLPSNTVFSCLVDGFDVWVGTDRGLARSNAGDLSSWKVYDQRTNPELPSEGILRVRPGTTPGTLYCVTGGGLMSFDVVSGKFEMEFNRAPVSSVLAPEGGFGEWRAFVATDAGVYGRSDSGGWNVLGGTEGMKAKALALYSGLLFIATENGLYSYSPGGEVRSYPEFAGRYISALAVAADHGSMWIGERVEPGAGLTVWRMASPGMVRSYGPPVTGIPDRDNYRFRDVDAADHTATGFAGNARASYTYGRGDAFLRYERIEPGFTGIGRPERQDLLSWGLGGSYRISDSVKVNLDHGVDRTATPGPGGVPSEDYPVTVVRDRVGASIHLGPRVDLGYVTEGIDDLPDPGEDKRRQSYSVSLHESFFEDRLGVGLGYEFVTLDDKKDPGSSYEAHNIIGDLDFRDASGLYLRLRYRQPIKVSRPGTVQEARSGIEGLSWSANWTRDLGTANLRASYDDESRRDLLTGQSARVRRGHVNLGFREFAVGNMKLRPTLGGSWGQDAPSAAGLREDVRGEARVAIGLGDLKSSLGYSVTRYLYPDQDKQSLEGEVSLSASYRGMRSVVPSLELRMKNGTSSHPVYGTKASGSSQATFRVGWTPAAGYSSEAFLSYKEETAEKTELGTLGIGSRLSGTLRPGLSAAVGLNFERIQGTKEASPEDEIRTEFTGSVSYRLSELWSTSLEVSYVRGLEGDKPYTTGRTSIELRARL